MEIIPLIISFITSVVVAYVTAKYQIEIAAQNKLDESLRETRYEVYKILWKKTGLFSRWPKRSAVTYSELNKLSEAMRSWYYEVGGIYLSEVSRKVYGDAQKEITIVLEKKPEKDEKIEPSSKHYNAVMEKLSALRTQLARDVSSRRNAPSYLSNDRFSN
jgi:hypothetical protein